MNGGRITINGKFLGAGLNGVHRTAAQFACQLLIKMSGTPDVRLVAPGPTALDPNFPLLVPQIHPGVFGAGQGWEMLTLPFVARGDLLLNFCNLAPLIHSRSIVMIHDAQTYLYPQDYTSKQAIAYRAILPVVARRALRVFTVSEFSRQSLAQFGVCPASKIDVIHNGTDHILSEAADTTILAKHGLTKGSYVLTLGSAKGYKNIRRVFDAMTGAGAPDLPLVVAGGPVQSKYIAAGWTPPRGTLFTGFVSDAELRALYAHARVFAFPSQTEGFGLPPIEAMHCDCPVVAAKAGAMPEVCGDAALLVDPDDTAAWRAALIRVVSDDVLARELIQKGRIHASTLSWEAAGSRLQHLLSPFL